MIFVIKLPEKYNINRTKALYRTCQGSPTTLNIYSWFKKPINY
jgi:hypothetical protein